jgi:glycosyltransferase involved in cell wall biosynthesis
VAKAFHQLLPNFSPRDAIGNESLLIQETLRKAGFDSEIYCGDGFQTGQARSAKRLRFDLEETPNSKVLFHFSVGTDISRLWPTLNCERWIRYHNITPMQFFTRSDELHARHMCGLGRIQLGQVTKASGVLLADSAYNASEIQKFSDKPVHVIPVFRDYECLLTGVTDQDLVVKISDKSVLTALFIGRVSPNKCHHDLLQLLALHRKVSNRKVRLIFAGGYFSASYKNLIGEFSAELGLKLAHDWDFSADVLSLGSVSDAQLTALYKSADLYVSMSEHEGFGVPMVESMYFDLPVFAHRATALPEILGEGEFLVDKFDWQRSVKVFDAALINHELRAKERARVHKWRSRFGLDIAKELLHSIIQQSEICK